MVLGLTIFLIVYTSYGICWKEDTYMMQSDKGKMNFPTLKLSKQKQDEKTIC